MPGPAPKPNRRRRNTPTIQNTNLPASGRSAPVPDVPAAYELASPGLDWWNWAWRLPQATRWDGGAVYAVARRAQLEDLLVALDFADTLDLSDLLMGCDPEAIRRVEWALATLKRAATGCMGVMKEMRELDKRLGLDPKALVELRWTITDSDDTEQTAGAQPVANVRRLRAVEA